MDNLLFSVIALFCCVAVAGGAMVYLLELLWTRQILPYLQSVKKKSEVLLGRASKVGETAEEIIAKYVELYENTAFERKSGKYGSFCEGLLIEMLERNFTVEAVRQYCDLAGYYCTYIYKITDGETKTEFLIAGQVSPSAYTDSENRASYNLVHGGNIEDYVSKENKIMLMSCLEIIGPIGADFEKITECVNSASVERIHYQDIEIEKNAHVYRLTENTFGNIELIRVWQPIKPIKIEHLDSLYAPIEIEIDNTNVLVPASKCIDIAASAMLHGENLYIRGPWGTGKSTYAGQLQHKLSTTDGVRVILITATQFMDLYNSSAQSGLISELSPDPTGKNPIRNVLFIDEAELLTSVKDQKAISMLRSMLDGELKNQLNCSICLIFNAKTSELDAGLMRPGRKNLVFNINALNEGQAWNAVKVLRNSMANKVFNKEKFESILSGVNSVEGIKYAERGFIALADIAVSCFQRKDYRAQIIDAIKAAAQKEEPVKKFLEKSGANIAPRESKPQQQGKKRKGMIVKFPTPQVSK